MRKLISSLLVIVFGLFLVSSSNLKANEEHIVEAIDGASIRTQVGEIEQGLRFYAKLNGEADEHGFYLVFGEATIFDLEDALRDQGTDEFAIVNGKEVFRVEVPGVTAKNEFSVVLTGIPGPGYLQKISVFPFAVVDGQETFVDPVTRSVGEVAFKAAIAGDESGDVIPYLEENYKRMHLNYDGNVALTGNMFESDHLKLREEFLKDWNAKFGLSLPDLEATAFFNSAKTGLEGEAGSNKDLSPSHLYKFFNDEFYEVKWGWLLDYMIDNCGIYHASRQSWAIQGDGTFWDDRLESNQDVLYNGDQLSYSIANFFNKENKKGSYTAIDFTTGNRYATVSNYNDKIYVDLNKYELFKIGDVIEVGYPGDRAGYVFKHFLIGGEIYLSGQSSVITEDDVVIQMIYEAIEYDIEFYLGETLLDELSTTYNIEDELVLDPLDEDGFVFKGWYDNPELQGTPITSIPKGSMGDKKFYAKMVAEVEVTYHLNGGQWVPEKEFTITRYNGGNTGEFITMGLKENYGSVVGLYWDRLYLEETENENLFSIIDFGVSGGEPSDADYDYVIGAHINATDIQSKNAVTSLAKAESIGKLIVLSSIPEVAGAVTIVAKVFSSDDLEYALNNLTQSYAGEIELKNLRKDYYDFDGWYEDAGFTSNVITIIEASESAYSMDLYAKFTPKTYSITYVLNDGATSDAGRATSYTYESPTINLPLDETMSRDGFTFGGWYDNDAFAGSNITSIFPNSHGDKVFYAQWIADIVPELNVSNDDVVVLNTMTPDVIVSPTADNGIAYILKGTGLDQDYDDLEIVAYSSISSALSYLNAGELNNKKVYIVAGTYSSALQISAEGTLLYGPNYNVHGHDIRTSEAHVTGLTEILAANVEINGLRFSAGGAIKVGANYATISHIYTNATQVDGFNVNRRGTIVDSASMKGLTVKNSWIKAPGASQSYTTQFMTFGVANDLTIEGNYIENEATTLSSSYAGMRIYSPIGTINIINNEIHFATTGYVMVIGEYAHSNVKVNIIDNILAGRGNLQTATIQIKKGTNGTYVIRGNQFINFGPATYNFNADVGSNVTITYNYYDDQQDYRVSDKGNANLTLDYNCYAGTIAGTDVSGAAAETTSFDSLQDLQDAYAIAYPKE